MGPCPYRLPNDSTQENISIIFFFFFNFIKMPCTRKIRLDVGFKVHQTRIKRSLHLQYKLYAQKCSGGYINATLLSGIRIVSWFKPIFLNFNIIDYSWFYDKKNIWPTFHQFFCHKGKSNPLTKKFSPERLPLSYTVEFFIMKIRKSKLYNSGQIGPLYMLLLQKGN